MKRVFSLIVAMFFLTLLFHGQAAKANSISVLDSGTIEFQDADGDGFRDRDPNPIKEEITDVGAKPDLIGGAPLNPDGVVSSEPLGTLNGASAEGISAPTINLWYGQNQSFGKTGQPQRFVNILGNIDSTKLQNVTATYALNGGAAQPLSLGADPYRLAEAGDFNVELATSDLNVGANSVKIVADDGEETAELTVNFTYENTNVWPINTTVNWTNNTLRNSAQVVDGQWTVENGTIRPLVFDYDRMVVLGDMTWEDYEVTVPIKINSYDDSGFNGPANGAAVGVLVRWNGHLSDGNQPSVNWRNLGALGWYRWAPSGAEGFEMRGNGGGYIQSNSNITLDFGTQYMFKMSVQSVDGEPTSYYRFKFWEQGEDEPVDWLLEGYGLGPDNGNGVPAEPATGSVALLAHHVDANFGQVKVEPLSDIDPTLTTESSANGSVYVSPPGDYETIHEYDYNDKVTITGQPDYGYVFDNWTGDVPDDANSNDATISFRMYQDMTLKANFVPHPPTELTINTVGNGTVTVSPDKPTYDFAEEVTLTAEADPGYSFNGWSGDASGIAKSITVKMEGDLTITATFVDEDAVSPMSDDFNSCSLSSFWSFMNPLGSGSYEVNGTDLMLTVPAGTEHNLYDDAADAPRVMQNTQDDNFELEVKFNSVPTERYQMQGIMIQQDADTWLRFDFYNDGSTLWANNTRLLNGSPKGGPKVAVSAEADDSLYLRVRREMDPGGNLNNENWQVWYSTDGQQWEQFGDFAFGMAVSSTGVFAGNVAPGGGGEAPGFTAEVDYFFNNASRISPEDGNNRSCDGGTLFLPTIISP